MFQHFQLIHHFLEQLFCHLHLGFHLTYEKLKLAKPEALVLHPGPINRNVEIEDKLADDIDKSVINEQVENG